MTASAAGTAVATRADRDAALTREDKLHIAKIRATRALTVAITNEAWGNALSPEIRHAIAEYMRRNRLDVNEIDVLGGKPYRNGNYYKRRVAEMRTKGVIEWTDGEHIGPDPQLDVAMKGDDSELAAWARAESSRRMKERIRWAVPADATHAYVVRIKLTTEKNPVEGCDFITPLRMKTSKYGEKIADPVGAAEPEKTVITRAWRRAGLLAAAEIPELRDEERAMDAEAVIVEQSVGQIKHDEMQREVSSARPQAALMASEEPYGAPTARTTTPATVETIDASQHRADPAVLQRYADMPDPYGDDAPASDTSATSEPAATDSSSAEPVRSAAWRFPMPFGTEQKGKPIGEFSDEDLTSARKYAEKRKVHPELIAAIDTLLDERATAAEDARFADAEAEATANG